MPGSNTPVVRAVRLYSAFVDHQLAVDHHVRHSLAVRFRSREL